MTKRRPDPRLLRGLLLLGALLLGGPLVISTLAGLFTFAAQPPRLAVDLDAPAQAHLEQELILRLRVSNPHDDPLILATVRLDEALAEALGPPRFDPPPYQPATDVSGLPPGQQFDIPLETGREVVLTMTMRPQRAGAVDGRFFICRPGDAGVCTAVPLLLEILPAP